MTERQGLDSFDGPPVRPTADVEGLLGATAAPGPQQPDEDDCGCWHDTMFGRCTEHGVRANWDMGGEGYTCACPRPAAPSAQPAPGTPRHLFGDAINGSTLDDRTPTQPVRDTEEGRR